jgi:hypothetical protein
MSEASDLVHIYEDDDPIVAIQAACQMAERLGEDMAILMNLEVVPLSQAGDDVIEIIRCPLRLRKDIRRPH